ncbi:synaptotagmin-14b isoform X2 [Hypomesus transpacificus]|uniref:synaptotagmin-14b isoform X2 n=1 Tax=Hypomesus transpacificus TaxID=137520 RepID=UPI001F084A82|nr:synaptotagmin-14b isoform X2 [Hypomesus transpacificus]
MAFFKSFQQSLPSVNISSILDTVSSRVDDLASAVSDATYTVSDQLTEQVTTIINKVQEEEEVGGATQEEKVTRKSKKQASKDPEASTDVNNSEFTEGEYSPSQLEWEWRDGCWRVKKPELSNAKEEKEKEEKIKKEEEEYMYSNSNSMYKMIVEKTQNSQQETIEKDYVNEEASFSKEECNKKDILNESAKNCENSTSPSSEEERKTLKQNKCGGKVEEPSFQKKIITKGEFEENEGNSPTQDKKKTDTKKSKGSNEDSEKAEKSKYKKKNMNTNKSHPEGGLSDSEEEWPLRGPEVPAEHHTSTNRPKNVTEHEGYSSVASPGHANSIQRIQRDFTLNELHPPPYQDKDVPAHKCHKRGSSPEVGSVRTCHSSEASLDQDTDSYLNKGYEEDVPSDSTAVLGPEDGSAPQLPIAYEPEPLAKYGTLDVAFEYDSDEQWLAVTVTAATDIPALKQMGNISWQVHLVLLPTKKQRAKTGVQKGPCPVFTETFRFSRVEQEALGHYAVRFRLYSVRRMKKEKVLGEKVFYLTKLNLQGKMVLPVTLDPGSTLTGCGSLVSISRSAGALSYRSTGDSSCPEILLGLIYNSTTGRLSAEVIQGSHFKNTASEKPTNGLLCCVKELIGGQLYIMRDTYVKLTMVDSKGKEMSKCKTAVCRGQPNPTYKETFVFQVALFQLSEVSLVVTVFWRRSSMKPREKLGWVSLGLNSTGEEQQAHWTQMKEAEGQQVCQWHTLMDT